MILVDLKNTPEYSVFLSRACHHKCARFKHELLIALDELGIDVFGRLGVDIEQLRNANERYIRLSIEPFETRRFYYIAGQIAKVVPITGVN